MTLGFTDGNVIPVFRSDDNGATWQPPVNEPGRSVGRQAVDHGGQLHGRGARQRLPGVAAIRHRAGIYFFRSTDGAAPTARAAASRSPGQPGRLRRGRADHAVYVWWYAGSTLQMRKSTDQGLTFGPAVTAASGLVGGTNGDLG